MKRNFGKRVVLLDLHGGILDGSDCATMISCIDSVEEVYIPPTKTKKLLHPREIVSVLSQGV